MDRMALALCAVTTAAWGVGMFAAKFPVDRIGWYYQSMWVSVSNALVLGAGAILLRAVAPSSSPVNHNPLDRRALLQSAMVGLAFVVGGLAFNKAITRERVSLVVAVTSVYPVVSAALAWLFLKDALSARQIAGLLLVVVGLALLSAKG